MFTVSANMKAQDTWFLLLISEIAKGSIYGKLHPKSLP
jgi:hypothetical protein